MHANPFVRLTARRAVLALATTAQTAERLRGLGSRRILVHSNVGLPAEEIRRLKNFPHRLSNPFRVLSIGNLLHWKGFELGLRAFAKFHPRFPESEYWLIGDGPERNRLERLANKLGVADTVIFKGTMPRHAVHQILAECDVLIHPSLHDSGGWVCSEAMAAGRPVICLDLGGPGLQITDDTGIKVPAVSPRQAIRDLATALTQLANDPALRVRMGHAARQRVEECFNWEKKASLMMEMYARAIKGEQRQAC